MGRAETDGGAYRFSSAGESHCRTAGLNCAPCVRGSAERLPCSQTGADGLIALDHDRAMRDPRDLEDLIDLVEQSSPRIPIQSVTGSLRLANDGNINLARVMCAAANRAARDTARPATHQGRRAPG